MKKTFNKLFALLAAVSMSIAAFSGCALVTKNTDKEMRQTIATVKIDDLVDAADIYKRDMIAGYVSYGYYYVQNNNYTTSQAYSLILNNLIQNQVIVQQSRLKVVSDYKSLLPAADMLKSTLDELKSEKYLCLFASDKEIAEFEKQNKGVAKYSSAYYDGLNDFVYSVYSDKTTVSVNDDAFRFLDDVTVYEVISSIKESVNSMIESFVDDDDTDEDEYEKISVEARTVPTVETDEDEDDQKEKSEYKKTVLDLSDTKLDALDSAVKALSKNGLIGSAETYVATDPISVMSLSYFRKNMISSLESKLVNIYEEGLKADKDSLDYTKVDGDNAEAEKTRIAEALWKQYTDLQKKQQDKYKADITTYETDLGNVSKTSFVVYNPGVSGYSYVTHLVVEFSAEQKNIVTNIKAESNITSDQINAKVNELVKEIKVSDLRSSWVKSNYGVYDGTDFTFGKKYILGENELNTFKGSISDVSYYTTKNDNDEDAVTFNFGSVTPTEYNFDEFSTLAARVMGVDKLELSEKHGTDSKVGYLTNYTGSDVRINKADFNNFEDLKFAFSTDTGNFNKYLGYIYSPNTAEKTYVKAFAAACADVSAKGVGAYEMFASPEYGLHIVLCTAKPDYSIYSSKDAFVTDLTETESVANLFMKAHIDMVTDQYISDIVKSFINTFTSEDADYVVKYDKVYKDLITEEESAS